MKKNICIILMGLFLLTSNPLTALSVTLNFDGDSLLGVSGISVHDILYDVTFEVGSCVGIFGGCEADDFAFTDREIARDANDSLIEAFNGYSLPLSQYDINGIAGDDVVILNPFSVREDNSDNNYRYVFFDSIDLDSNNNFFKIISFLEVYEDLSDFDNTVFAKWTETNPVPEPSTLLLLGSGLVGLAFIRRKKLRQ